ncbi:uncharacterized protein Tco025E_05017 [Trypanosoma conorhini]|uniref:Uncharacterized protein n=1 Tax=Trypanosoma conorhini TaxID=83891 RepID=A0A3R7NDD1_9TRYP|nr:uncharacterized protein Tco025E_05017 [Trypanosoma conorhini]RNF16921.1 hypothetical protein Tco025E_05017 [Trypanosoma conorhini]
MTVAEEALCVARRTPPRCGSAEAVLAGKALSPHDKVRQFVEEQDSLHLPPSDAAAGAVLPGPHEDVDGDDVDASNVLPLMEGPTAVARETVSGRRRGKKQPAASRKRRRQGEDADDPLLLFRRSQKALRKEARHVSMKEVLSRSLSGVLDASSEASNPFSPTAGSQLSSAWSPLVASNITSRFLSNVKQQKKQNFERLMQKEIANSQLSISRLTTDDGESEEGLPELVIGDETAVMEPPLMEKEALLVDSGATLSQTDTLLMSSTTSRGFVELDEEAEQAQSEALLRKHELWRLRQKQLREQLREEETVQQLKRGERQATVRGQTSSTQSAMTVTTNSSYSLSATQVAAADVDGCSESIMLTQCSIIQRSQSLTPGLSADHIEMIRRANNFDNTSSQRVVVFKTQKSKKEGDLPTSKAKHSM